MIQRYGLDGRDVELLRKKWGNMTRTGEYIEFPTFDAFVAWCAENNYHQGMILRRIYPKGPYTRDNLYWDDPNDQTSGVLAARWDAFTAPLRARYRTEIDTIINKQKTITAAPVFPATEYWRYEHPDLVREGLTFLPSDC